METHALTSAELKILGRVVRGIQPITFESDAQWDEEYLTLIDLRQRFPLTENV